MFQMPVDAWYCWVGLAAVGVAVLGVAASLSTETAPDATALAETVDAVASSEHAATSTVRIDADRIGVAPHRIALRNDAGTASAAVRFGPVTPAFASANLSAVVAGRAPSAVYESAEAFARAARRARNRTVRWRDAPSRVRVRQVHWGETDVTLVG
jgi:hypothetical protein